MALHGWPKKGNIANTDPGPTICLSLSHLLRTEKDAGEKIRREGENGEKDVIP